MYCLNLINQSIHLTIKEINWESNQLRQEILRTFTMRMLLTLAAISTIKVITETFSLASRSAGFPSLADRVLLPQLNKPWVRLAFIIGIPVASILFEYIKNRSKTAPTKNEEKDPVIVLSVKEQGVVTTIGKSLQTNKNGKLLVGKDFFGATESRNNVLTTLATNYPDFIFSFDNDNVSLQDQRFTWESSESLEGYKALSQKEKTTFTIVQSDIATKISYLQESGYISFLSYDLEKNNMDRIVGRLQAKFPNKEIFLKENNSGIYFKKKEPIAEKIILNQAETSLINSIKELMENGQLFVKEVGIDFKEKLASRNNILAALTSSHPDFIFFYECISSTHNSLAKKYQFGWEKAENLKGYNELSEKEKIAFSVVISLININDSYGFTNGMIENSQIPVLDDPKSLDKITDCLGAKFENKRLIYSGLDGIVYEDQDSDNKSTIDSDNDIYETE